MTLTRSPFRASLAASLILLLGPGSSTAQSGPSAAAATETAFGLHTTTFDTLQGVVTVQLPSDVASGDVISGSVAAEPKGKTADEMAANQSELNGYVVEIDKTKVPAGEPGAARLVIPAGIALIPLILRSRDGKEVGRVEVPVRPTAASVSPGVKPTGNPHGDAGPAYRSPAFAQAGKPLAVQGTFDGDSGTSDVLIAGKPARILAESPRQVIVESFPDLAGSAEIEVSEKGRPVAHCTVQSVGIRLAADKLNLTRGESTTMTVFVTGLAAAKTMPTIRLVNRSPGNVRLQGGDTQQLTFDAREIRDGAYVAQRTVSAIQAGGFSINASVQGGGQRQCLGPTPGHLAGLPPVVARPSPPPPGAGPPRSGQPRPDQPVTPPVERPRSANDERVRPDRLPDTGPGRSRFRVTLNGFTVNQQTNDGVVNADGPDDEVTTIVHHGIADLEGHIPILSGGPTAVIERRQTGHSFPTDDTPWLLTATPGPGNPPREIFNGELTQGVNAVVILPTLWEWDSPSAGSMQLSYVTALERATPSLGSAVARMIRTPRPMALGSFLRPGADVGVGGLVSVAQPPFGLGDLNKPIGMQLANATYSFGPQALVLTYEAALFLSQADLFHRGQGIIDVRYQDDRSLAGDYTMFLEVEELNADGSSATHCAPTTGTFAGTARMTTDIWLAGAANPTAAQGPFDSSVDLTVEWSDCGRSVRVLSLVPITTPDFETPWGPNAITITQTGTDSGGFFDAASGSLEIPVTLHLTDRPRLGLIPDTNVRLTLSTASDGGQAVSGRHATLVGTGSFLGGAYFNNGHCRVVVVGDFSPGP